MESKNLHFKSVVQTHSNFKQAVRTSALLHLLLAVTVILLLYTRKQPSSEILDLTVFENPSIALSKPQTILKPKPAEESIQKIDSKKAVFGLNKNSLTTNSSEERGVSAKTGNTLLVAPSLKKMDVDSPDSLPIPSDDYLVTQMPELLYEVKIPYPEEAKKNKIQGQVLMDLLIDSAGVVRDAKLISGPGFGLNEAALLATKNFKFKPARIEDKSVAAKIRYAYRFVLQ